MKMKVLLALGLLGSLSDVHASLKWEQSQVELHPAPGDATAVGTFKYTNTGNTVVHFKSVHTSCGCTTAAQTKDQAAPGESGEITATFKVGASTGVQQKSVRVETDDPNEPFTTLVLRAVIPQLMELRPTFIYWESSEAPKPKIIAVKAAKELNTRSLKVTSSNANFATKVQLAGPNEFKIEVTPRDTANPSDASLKIEPDGGGKAFYATARVVNPTRAN